ncbi:MAG: ArsR/SmtB family transcription factor [Planctomycetota bacterium]
MKNLMAITKALSDETRVRALMFLRHGELCVCQIIDILNLAPSTVSKHMSILYGADLVESRKDGRWIYYRLPGRNADPAARQAIKFLQNALKNSPGIRKDDKKARATLKKNKGRLCALYRCAASRSSA